MKLLLKCPTRSRPEKIRKTLAAYFRFALHPENIGVAVSCDVDDKMMEDTSELNVVLSRFGWSKVYYSQNKNKIEACNADMDKIDYEWDIVVLVSDDMIPQIRGYDDVIRNEFLAGFPDRNGILWFNDGAPGEKLNTLCVFGREFYETQGFIYNPEYKSLFCDTELTDQCRAEYKTICRYVPYCIIRHEHPGTGFPQLMDKLYETNQKYWNDDMYTYIRRKNYEFDLSILIATIAGREASLRSLLSSVREKLERIAPKLRVEFCTQYDNKEISIGKKRQSLLQESRGKYMCFIDDDDDITDSYIEDIVGTIRGNYHVMRLRGQIGQYTFTHSTEIGLDGFMADKDGFLRPPNHLNPMLTDVAKFVSFRDATYGEDLDWALRLAKAGFLSKEYRSDNDRIHYIYNMGDRKLDHSVLELQQKTSYATMLQTIFRPTGAVAPAPPQLNKVSVLRLGRSGFISV